MSLAPSGEDYSVSPWVQGAGYGTVANGGLGGVAVPGVAVGYVAPPGLPSWVAPVVVALAGLGGVFVALAGAAPRAAHVLAHVPAVPDAVSASSTPARTVVGAVKGKANTSPTAKTPVVRRVRRAAPVGGG